MFYNVETRMNNPDPLKPPSESPLNNPRYFCRHCGKWAEASDMISDSFGWFFCSIPCKNAREIFKMALINGVFSGDESSVNN